jgi:PiT family inorganic phosphate transporter
MALTISNHYSGHDIPIWVKASTALALSLGTWAGGWRIMRTLGRKIIELDPPQGFAAESVGATILYVTAYAYKVPVSTTHIITSAIMGVGATKRVRAVRWGVAKNIVIGWFLTMPAAGIVAAVVFWVSWWIIG